MERVTHKFRLKPGASPEEYKRRHDEIWPEVSEAIARAGIHNYSIWNLGDELFEYYEAEDKEASYRLLAESEAMKRWDEYMDDMIELDIDTETGRMRELKPMFYHK